MNSNTPKLMSQYIGLYATKSMKQSRPIPRRPTSAGLDSIVGWLSLGPRSFFFYIRTAHNPLFSASPQKG
jgi:hypothetical protein